MLNYGTSIFQIKKNLLTLYWGYRSFNFFVIRSSANGSNWVYVEDETTNVSFLPWFDNQPDEQYSNKNCVIAAYVSNQYWVSLYL